MGQIRRSGRIASEPKVRNAIPPPGQRQPPPRAPMLSILGLAVSLRPARLPAPVMLYSSADSPWPEQFDKQPLEAEFADIAFVRPSNGDALRRFLLGKWRVRRVTQYELGGISGRFEGEAEFAEVPLDDGRSLVRYTESGEFRPGGDQLPSSSGGSLTTRNQLVYDFSNWERVDIYYDDPSTKRGPEADLADMRFLHSLRPETMELTDHPDGPDLYQGKFDIDAAHAFLTTWAVSGPRQSGNILAMYTRQDLSSRTEVLDVHVEAS